MDTLEPSEIAELTFVPLSESLIWELHRRYYHEKGVEAWQSNDVPSYVTTNPFIAHSYAQVALAFIRDMPLSDSDQPIYIVEMGAGSGRFAYHFLRTFFEEYGDEAQQQRPVCYVMTDISEANLRSWAGHAQLQHFVEQGRLDFAAYNPTQQDVLQLRSSGNLLSADTLEQPLLCIANYLFDCIEQDVFEIIGGRLYECRVALSDKEMAPANDEPRAISNTQLLYELRPSCGDYYENPLWNQLLVEYSQALTNAALPFPVAGLCCLERLRALSKGRLLLITADRGQHSIDDLEGLPRPQLLPHGETFSLDVNYHALGWYVRHLGGVALQPSHLQRSISINAFLWGESDFANTRAAYQQHMHTFGPDDFFVIKKGMEHSYDKLSLAEVRGFLRLSRWDSKILQGCHQQLSRLLPQANRNERRDFSKVMDAVVEQYFFLKEPTPMNYIFGVLYAGLGDFSKALQHYHHTEQCYGQWAALLLNISLAYRANGDYPQSLKYVQTSLQLEPDLEPSKKLLAFIQKEMSEPSKIKN